MSAIQRSEPPAPAPVRAFEFPDIEASQLSNGLELRAARLPRLPLVSAVLVLAASESAVSDEQAGLAVLTGDTLDGGTAKHSASELAEAFESIGASLHASTGWDATTVSFTCVAERLPRALELMAEVVRSSVFPEREVARTRDQHMARLQQRRMDPGSIANDWASHLFYADGVPYARPLAGTEESLSRLDREAVVAFAERAHRPGRGGIVLSGDVDLREAAALAQEYFGGWEGEPPPRSDFVAEPRHPRRSVHIVHRPGAVQSELRVGYPALPRNHADYFPLVVANTVLGGAFTSRLNLNLRERHGFTYGVRSGFSFRRGPGPFSVSTSVGSDVTADAVRETFTELEAFALHGPTDEEVRGARDYVAGVFPLRMETAAQVAGRVAELLIYGLPDDHHVHYRDRIREVTPEVARAAAARHIRPEEMTVVVVGDADVVRAPLEALNLGPMQVHTIEAGQ